MTGLLRSPRGLALAAVLLATIGVVLGACDSNGGTPTAVETPTTEIEDHGFRGRELAEPLPRPEFVLTDTSGSPFDFRDETEGQVTLLYFGYTHCPDICPSHMADVAAVLSREPGLAESVKVVFVTVDPERDTAERLRLWLDLFDPTFIGLSGTAEQIDDAGAKALGSIWAPVEKAPYGEGEYAVSHPAVVIAYGKDNLARSLYPFGTRKADYAHDLALLVNGG